MELRKIVAESGLNYEKVANIFTSAVTSADSGSNGQEDKPCQTEDGVDQIASQKAYFHSQLKSKIPEADPQDIDELIELFHG